MDQISSESDWSRRLEECLQKACDAEARGDQVEAERFFRMALRCEAKLRDAAPDEQLMLDLHVG